MAQGVQICGAIMGAYVDEKFKSSFLKEGSMFSIVFSHFVLHIQELNMFCSICVCVQVQFIVL